MKRICVFGLGGIGGYVGARLSTTPVELSFVVRGRHLEAIKEKGLLFQSSDGSRLTVRPKTATSKAEDIGSVDLGPPLREGLRPRLFPARP